MFLSEILDLFLQTPKYVKIQAYIIAGSPSSSTKLQLRQSDKSKEHVPQQLSQLLAFRAGLYAQ